MVPRTPSSRRVSVAAVCLALALVVPAAVVAGPGGKATGAAGPATDAACVTGETLHESGNLSVRTFVAPGETYDRLTNASAVAAANESGLLTPASANVDRTYDERVAAYRDVIVHRIRLSGSSSQLLDRLTDGNRSPTAAFRTLVAGDGVEFEYVGATACPPRLALNASIDRGAIRVVPDRRNDTLNFVLDTDRLLFHPLSEGEPTTDTYVKGHHGFTFSLRTPSGLVTENVTVETDYQVEDAVVEFDARREGVVRVEADGEATVRGRALLAPRTEVTLRFRPHTDGETITRTATVDDTRRFVTELDLPNATGESVYSVEALSNGQPLIVGETPTLVVVGNASGAVVDLRTQNNSVTTLYGPSITTTDGGFVVVRNAEGETLAVSEYQKSGRTSPEIDLPATFQGNRTVTATVYRDANGNREFDDADSPYRRNGSAVRDTATVRLESDVDPTPTPTPTRTPTRTRTRTPTTDAGDAVTPTATPTTATDDSATATQPGFGVVVALLGLIAAGAIAARRRR